MLYLSTVSFALGILGASFFSYDFSFIIFLIFILTIVALVLYKENKKVSKILLLVTLSFFVGFLRMSAVETSVDTELQKVVGEKVVIDGRVADEPDMRDGSVRYVLESQSSNTKILVVAESQPIFKYGDELKIGGRLDLPKNFINDNGAEFDYIAYLRKEGIGFVVFYPEIEFLDSGGFSLKRILFDIKSAFISKINAVVGEPNSSLIGGLIFGAKQSLGAQLLDDFRKVGLIHIVVLSGYNITIIAAAIFFVTNKIGKRNFGFVVASIFITLFALMVGFGATVVRACIMALIAILARFLGRPADALRWLFVAGFLMLLYNPLYITSDPSFQLSFMATLGLILFSPFVSSFIATKLPFIIEKYGLREIVSSTIAVQIFILPLLIRMSGEISLISFLVNPIVLPIIPLAMGLGALTSFVGLVPLIGYYLSWPIGALAYFVTSFVIKIVELSASLPFATLTIHSLPLYAVFIWYGVYAVGWWRLRRE